MCHNTIDQATAQIDHINQAVNMVAKLSMMSVTVTQAVKLDCTTTGLGTELFSRASRWWWLYPGGEHMWDHLLSSHLLGLEEAVNQ